MSNYALLGDDFKANWLNDAKSEQAFGAMFSEFASTTNDPYWIAHWQSKAAECNRIAMYKRGISENDQLFS